MPEVLVVSVHPYANYMYLIHVLVLLPFFPIALLFSLWVNVAFCKPCRLIS